MTYDDFNWHYGDDFPEDSPSGFAATHIALFLKWCIIKGFASDIHKNEYPKDIEELLNGTMRATVYFLKNCDGKLTNEDLNDEGNAFAQRYYGEEGLYLSDYVENFGDLFYLAPEREHDFEKFSSMLEGRVRSGILTESEIRYDLLSRISYFLYVFLFGSLIICIIVFAGMKGYNFWLSTILGGIAQTVFRLSKRMLKRANITSTEKSSKAEEQIVSWSALNVFVFIFLFMMIVSAFWYGIGVLLNRII
ncbi:MAG: hypothetical protein ACRBF0_22645 [Calditrichia bacterium]